MDKAISEQEFAALMTPLLPPKQRAIAVACSGGPDSMTLTFLMHNWARNRDVQLTALIVDHGLRANAAEEAAQVAGWLGERGVDARVLSSDGPKPDSNIQMEARSLRYRLISDWCTEHGVETVCLAHHQDDQAETFLLRLARGSGVDGLAAMQTVSRRDGMVLLRPLLSVPKTRLVATLKDAGWPSVSDPSNQNTDFARVRMRALLPVLAREGLDAERLSRTANNMAEASLVLDDAVQALMRDCVTLSSQGFATLDVESLLAARSDTARRLLSQSLSRLGGLVYPPRLDRIERLLTALEDGSFGAGRTAAGCRLMLKKGEGAAGHNKLLICRETAGITAQPARTGPQVWDGRFELTLDGDVSNAVLAPLGVEGWRCVASLSTDCRRKPPGPAPVRRGLPGLWVDGRLAAAPSLGVVDPLISGPNVLSCTLSQRLNALSGPFH